MYEGIFIFTWVRCYMDSLLRHTQEVPMHVMRKAFTVKACGLGRFFDARAKGPIKAQPPLFGLFSFFGP